MDFEAIRAFVNRPWGEAEALKRSYWAERCAAEGPRVTVEASEALRDHASRVCSGWPSERDRAEDLEHHLELKRLLSRVASALAAG